MRVIFQLPSAIYQRIHAHLLPPASTIEQAAFVFVRADHAADGSIALRYVDWKPIVSDGFLAQYSHYLELSDNERAAVIKQAHDLAACIVEFHSHPGPYPAVFSRSDLSGFQEFVPHVRWRLKGRPYAAIVVAPSGFDALAWTTSTAVPHALDAIVLDGVTELLPTALTLLEMKRKRAIYEPG